MAEIPIWRMRWPWRPLSHEQRKTALAGVTWALVGWLVVPANEVRAVFGWDDHNSLPLMQRGLLALLFAWIVLHFRGKYLRAKEVAEAADRFTHSGSYDINNRGRAIYVSHLIEMVRLHRALDAWKGQVSSGSPELKRTLDAEQELAQRNSQG